MSSGLTALTSATPDPRWLRPFGVGGSAGWQRPVLQGAARVPSSILNRSPDAVSSVALAVAWNGGTERYLWEDTLRPCVEITYTAEHLLAYPHVPPVPSDKLQHLSTVYYKVERLGAGTFARPGIFTPIVW
jgi:hypothetical protein